MSGVGEQPNTPSQHITSMPARHNLLLLDKHQVEQLLAPQEVLSAVREAFVLHGRRAGRVFPFIREKLPGGAVFGIKAGDVPAHSLLGFKAAGFWPSNRQRGSEPHQATIVLVDPTNGRPTCILDGNAVTAQRTGAAGGLGLDLLARPDSSRVCVFGAGVQARAQLMFALWLRPLLQHVTYLTSNQRADAAFEAAFADRCHIEHSRDPNAAVTASDVVITATPGRGPLFDTRAVRPGTHLNCVGSDTIGKREVPSELLARARMFVDDREQARQIGELQWVSPDTPCTELGEALLAIPPFERHRDDITLFDMTGIALQDLTVANSLFMRAARESIGTSLPWPW